MVEKFGGPEVMELREVDPPVPTRGMVLVEVEAAGVNFADTHAVENSYLSEQRLPLVPGSEVIGRTADGRRMCGFTVGTGGYADKALLVESLSVDVPDDVPATAALGLLVQGLTAWHLLKTSARMVPGDTVVVHAAAGGVGSLAVQLAKLWGAGRVIATAGTPDKRTVAVELGADVAVDPAEPELAQMLRAANGGKRVDVVLEMVAGHVFDQSLAALGRFGRIVTFGMASRQAATPVPPGSLMVGSKSLIGFWLADCLAVGTPDMVARPLTELLAMVQRGELRPLPGQSYPLAEARLAHEDLRGRRTMGKVILTP